jgi:hypothetical protein
MMGMTTSTPVKPPDQHTSASYVGQIPVNTRQRWPEFAEQFLVAEIKLDIICVSRDDDGSLTFRIATDKFKGMPTTPGHKLTLDQLDVILQYAAHDPQGFRRFVSAGDYKGPDFRVSPKSGTLHVMWEDKGPHPKKALIRRAFNRYQEHVDRWSIRNWLFGDRSPE